MVILVWLVLALSAAARAHGVEQTEITKGKSCQSSYFTGSAIKVSQRAKNSDSGLLWLRYVWQTYKKGGVTSVKHLVTC